jgi:mRNA-degrading endonuclease toxin of MazEF toxin-antitoxin module
VLRRGEVRFGDITFPGRGTLQKLMVVLQGGQDFANQTDVAVLVASTYLGGTPRPFEVLVPAATPGFNNDTVIDCRWPYTVRRAQVEAMHLLFLLSPDVIELIDEALVVGLQMAGP